MGGFGGDLQAPDPQQPQWLEQTGGFGYRAGRVAFDYGFSTGGGTLDSTHQFGLRLSWGGEAP